MIVLVSARRGGRRGRQADLLQGPPVAAPAMVSPAAKPHPQAGRTRRLRSVGSESVRRLSHEEEHIVHHRGEGMRAYFIGSVNGKNAEEVIGAIAEHAGDVTQYIPDGETGDRKDWFEWQVQVLSKAPQLEGVGEQTLLQDYVTFARFRMGDGVTADELQLGPLGYADAANTSYQIFRRLKEEGTIRSQVRFLVSLPTAVAVTFGYLEEGQLAFENGYERHLLSEIGVITDVIPESELAIQWDVAVEMGMLEGVFPTYIGGDLLSEVTARLGRLGDAVPASVALGYHLCYGNRGNEHFREPTDTGNLVKVANALTASCHRPIDWVHMPVPIERDDDAYFDPLRELDLQSGTELVLGLLHKEDGLDGAARRMAAARRMVGEFAVAAECGLGREPAEAIEGLLDLHAEACRELALG